MSLLPDPILEGVGDFLLTAGDRYAYTVSVSPLPATSCEGCLGKKTKSQKMGGSKAGI